MMRAGRFTAWLCTLLSVAVFSGCGEAPAPEPGAPPVAKELVVYDWEDDIPASVLDAFTREYGVKIIYPTYETTEEAVQNLRAGKTYDVVVVDNSFVPALIGDRLIAEIDFRNVPNFRNLSVNFRGLVFDPDNRYSVTYSWGIVGLIVRGDRVRDPVTRWVDLWDPRFSGQVMVWDLPRYLIGIALQSLGFSINSESPPELEAALQRLLTLKAQAHTAGWTPGASERALASGETLLMYGWSGDMLRARDRGLDVRYVVPADGSFQWSDTFVIPRTSQNKSTAELFINFMLRPEISAQVANALYYPTANEEAYPFIEPEILNDPVIFPPKDQLLRAEVIMPLSPSGQALHDSIWQRYLAAAPPAVSGAE